MIQFLSTPSRNNIVTIFSFLLCVLLSACNGSGVDDPSNTNQPPQITLDSHETIKSVRDNFGVSTVLNSESVVLSVLINDVDSNFDYVELLYDGQRLGQVKTVAPFEWTAQAFNGLAAGVYAVKVVAWDTSMASSTLDHQIKIVRNASPLIFWTFPLNNFEMSPSEPIDVTVDVSDADGLITSVELFLDSVSIAVKTAAPYTWSAQDYSALRTINTVGSHVFRVEAIDDNGEKSSSSIRFTVKNVGEASLGKALWEEKKCISCHGQVGQGGENARITIPAKQTYTFTNALGTNNYTLEGLIEQQMPTYNTASCDAVCAKNIAAYIENGMEEDRDQRERLLQQAGNVSAGETIYVNQCASCHGPRGLGTAQGTYLFPLKDTYRDTTQHTDIDLFTRVDLYMPKGNRGLCQGECVADVLAYLRSVEQTLTANEWRAVQLENGRKHYNACSTCHGATGADVYNGVTIIPLSSNEINNDSYNGSDRLYQDVLRMQRVRVGFDCVQCSKDISLYIRDVLQKNYENR